MSISSPETELPAFGLEKPGYVESVFALVFVWGFGDAVSTLIALAFTGDIGMEANPFVRQLLAHHPLLMLAMKAAVALIVGVTLLTYRDTIERVPLWRSWILTVTGLGTLIVVTNVYVGLSAI
ncbi:DUF5658 family protein [Halorientalis regularis]|jgi:hypothetical protein|uniref:DUF5658 domain-containing protein n=1 Tax=Halorientalis regularis TaxID=660518 RepID=A0A1G7PY74_9EURY|nr:DUF5658 family protein [Halorientalis regularis]SDF91191.1 hypothetical protein SAMN05216218_11173 [Halorientalis regularis]